MSITKKSSQFSPEEEINRNNKSIEKKKNEVPVQPGYSRD